MLYLLHQSVTRSAELSPDHEAVRFQDSSLTYGELEQRSNRLAHLLIEDGVRRGDRVGILANKSLEMAVAIYGIMKAGGAYVPLDPTAPPGRLAKIIRNCGIRTVVTHEAKRRTLADVLTEVGPLTACVGIASGDDIPIACCDWETAMTRPSKTPDVGTIEQDLAYVLYTSGSTSEPKGIMHTHRSALAFAEVAASTYGFHQDDRLSNHAPLHFDLSTMDFFSAAIAGATTVIIPEAHTKFPASLSELVESERLTVLYAVPLALTQLMLNGALERRDLSAVRWVLFGGEPFPTKHLRRLMEMLPHARFSNVYGPTEVNGCTYYLVPPIPADSDEPIPIGGLYDNAEALVVDETDQPVEKGEPGELLIRSATRMVGYWGMPDLTEKSTYRRETSVGCIDLFHRTGDLVIELPEEGFKFIGRKDRQIKTRGHRVELDEIEAALLSHDMVEEAAAYPLPDGEGSQRVVAAVILTEGPIEKPEDLDKHLRDQLPPYAVPTQIDVLDAFPLTTTGKIDRRRLRERALEAAGEL